MTATIQEVDALLEALSCEESDLLSRIRKLQDDQKTCDLLLLAMGLRKLYPSAEQLHTKVGGIRETRGLVAVALTDADGNELAAGHDLGNTAIEGWAVNDLLDDLSTRNDGEWIKAVSSAHDDHWDECECAIYVDGMEPFAIDLDKASALALPAAARAEQDEPFRQPETEILGTLRAGLMQAIPGAYQLYITQTDRGWEADGLCDSEGAGLRFGEILEEVALPGGQTVAQAVTRLAETGYLDTLPRDGNTVGILLSPVR